MKFDYNKIWQIVLGELEVEISPACFKTWFAEQNQTKLQEINDKKAIVAVSNIFAKEWFENKFHKLIFNALQKTTKCQISQIEYKIIGAENRKRFIANRAQARFIKPKKNKKNYKTNLNPKYTFSRFIVGESNELARAACLAVAQSPGKEYNPLFIYGGVGLGKTHLVQAVGRKILDKKPETKVVYITSEDFTNDFIESLTKKRIEDFKARYRQADVLIIDDVQFLGLKEQTQNQFFHTFNTLYQNNKQIILTSDRLPKAIPGLEERLVSRFECGMVADVGIPDLEMRIAILKEKAEEKKIHLDSESIHFIAQNIQNNIRELEGAANKIAAHFYLNYKKIGLNEIKKILQDMIQPIKKFSLPAKDIIDVVANFYNLDIKNLLGPSRKKEVSLPRQILMFLMREETNASFPSIGEQLNNRDHTTILHAYRKITKSIQENNNMKQEIASLRQRLYSKMKK